MIVLNRDLTGVPSVVTDNPRGMRRAVEHLAELGHTSITYAAGPESSWADGMRWRALREAGHELVLHTRRVGPYAPTIEGGARAAADLVDSLPTAVIAYNDLVAIGMLAGARTLGYHCPEDISVVGIDDLDIAAAAEPGLTSVRVPISRSGSLALELLLEQIAGKPTATEAVHLNSQLIVRGSTFAVRNASQTLQGK
jgi:LacI family transcriptional regulator